MRKRAVSATRSTPHQARSPSGPNRPGTAKCASSGSGAEPQPLQRGKRPASLTLPSSNSAKASQPPFEGPFGKQLSPSVSWQSLEAPLSPPSAARTPSSSGVGPAAGAEVVEALEELPREPSEASALESPPRPQGFTGKAERLQAEVLRLRSEAEELRAEAGELRSEVARLREEARLADLHGCSRCAGPDAVAWREALDEAPELRRQLEVLREGERKLQEEVAQALREQQRRHGEALAQLEAAAEGAAAEYRRQAEAQQALVQRLEERLSRRDAWWRDEIQRLWDELAVAVGPEALAVRRVGTSTASPEAFRLARAAIARAIAPHAEVPPAAA